MTKMAYDFNAAEVFEMAIQIEANGAEYYRKAAALQENSSDRHFLENLARMEDRHKTKFEEMIKKIADSDKTKTVFDPDEELTLYLQAMADAHGGEGNPDVSKSFTGSETMEDIISTAIWLEKESILFYVGLQDMVPPEYGRDKIKEIINEEKKHVVQLKGFLKKAVKAST